MKTMEKQEVGARSLACSTSRVEGVLELRDGTRQIDNHFNHSHIIAQNQTTSWLVHS
jgi:hypothetical protein